MTRDQAAQIVLLLNAAFVGTTLDVESADVYVDELALLHDPVVGAEVATMIIRQGDRFPTIAEFRRVYRTVAERHKPRELDEMERAPEDTPEWVQVWWWLRHASNERRPVPQQKEPDGMSPVEYEQYRLAWIEAGSPGPRTVRGLVS